MRSGRAVGGGGRRKPLWYRGQSAMSAPRGAALRRLLASPSPIVLAGAHDGLSARLVQEAGFDGVWASGFEISASHAVPDASILTMTETLDASRRMAEAVGIPVVADCDTGFGNAINAIRTVESFERAGVAVICIEDNVFPKRCSFYPGVKRLLTDVDEQALKIGAAVNRRTTPEFVASTRHEALIAGWGLDEALRRGRAYADAGADAILIHSNQATVDDIARFAEQWDRLAPLVCVPTTYATVAVDELARIGFKIVIFANHGLRASIRAVQETLAELRTAGRASGGGEPLLRLGGGVPAGQSRRDEVRRARLPAGRGRIDEGGHPRRRLRRAPDAAGVGSAEGDARSEGQVDPRAAGGYAAAERRAPDRGGSRLQKGAGEPAERPLLRRRRVRGERRDRKPVAGRRRARRSRRGALRRHPVRPPHPRSAARERGRHHDCLRSVVARH